MPESRRCAICEDEYRVHDIRSKQRRCSRCESFDAQHPGLITMIEGIVRRIVLEEIASHERYEHDKDPGAF